MARRADARWWLAPMHAFAAFSIIPIFFIMAAQLTQSRQGKIVNRAESILTIVCLIVHHWSFGLIPHSPCPAPPFFVLPLSGRISKHQATLKI